jgi:hypothetical protein
MKLLNRELDRRRLLGHLGFAALALPFYRVIQEEQLFGATPAKRALFFYFPDGIIKERWHPTETGSTFTLPPMTSPLSVVKDDILMLRGVNSRATGSHEGGAAYSLTGTNGGGLSIDTYLGEKLKADSLRPVVRLGVGSNFQDGAKISYFAPGSAAPIQDNPTLAFTEIFGKSTTPLDPAAQAKLLAGEKSILDFCMNDISGLQKKLGNIEKTKLQAHLDSLRELERRVQGASSGKPVSTSCTREVDMRGLTFPENDSNYPKAHHKNETYAVIGDIMIDLMVQSLACGVSNVGFLQWSRPVSPTVFNFPNGIDVARGHHDISHYGDLNGSGAADFIKAQQWYMTRLAELIKRLKIIKEGDQSMLQNTALMAFTEIADANLHDFSNVGLVLAGQAGGNWRTGRAIDAAGASHNQVLVSILQAFGLSNNSFGDAALGTGPIAELA